MAQAERVEAILMRTTLDEKVAMMSGAGFFQQLTASGGRWGSDPYRAGGGCERLGIPPLYFTDGPRGVARGQSTCFPCSMARGASFDPDLERRIGEVMGIEARAQGCTLSGAVCINLLRHPAWGRAQETYGEDPFHVGEMGAALAEGIQTHNVVATVKHFALNSMENARFTVNVLVDPRALHEVYLPHFKRVIDAGCASVMSAYNKMNGEYCGQNRHLLTDILRGDWGFDGFVHSDWVLGVRNVYGASAGLDVENPEPMIFGANLVQAVEQGLIEPQVIDEACRRILTVQYAFACAEDPLQDYGMDLVACDAHRALAREAAEKSTVLLTNDGILPLTQARLRRIAVIGRLADLENTGDHGSSRVRPPYVITLLAGLRDLLGDDVEIVTADEDDLDAVRRVAALSDVVIAVTGLTAAEEGEFIPGQPGDVSLGAADALADVLDEVADAASQDRANEAGDLGGGGGDRDSLTLPADQEAMIEAAAMQNRHLVVMLIGGSAIVTEAWRDKARAILQPFYCGMEGGRAIADILFGRTTPSGKLPFTVPRHAEDLPFFDKDAREIRYDSWHGYSLFEAESREPAFPFGHGLSYTDFAFRALKADRRGDRIALSVSVRNQGAREGTEVVQIYVGFPGSVVKRPRKLLKGFTRITLMPGETGTARLSIPLKDLTWWDDSTRSWRLEPGVHRIYAGGSSALAEDLNVDVRL
ncbi:MAG: beta-glucosidase [Alphaproteobacteria bacterium]